MNCLVSQQITPKWQMALEVGHNGPRRNTGHTPKRTMPHDEWTRCMYVRKYTIFSQTFHIQSYVEGSNECGSDYALSIRRCCFVSNSDWSVFVVVFGWMVVVLWLWELVVFELMRFFFEYEIFNLNDIRYSKIFTHFIFLRNIVQYVDF